MGARDPVPGVSARGPSCDLHHQRDRGPEQAAAKSGQDERTLPQRGGCPKTHLPRHYQRRPGVDPNPELDDRPPGVQDPLRRTATRLTAYTVSRTPSERVLQRAVTAEKVPCGRWWFAPGRRVGLCRWCCSELWLFRLCGLGSEGGSDWVEVDEDCGPDGLEGGFSSSEVAAFASLVAVDDESEQPLDPWPGAVEVVALGGVG